jgi:hypothetical protein
MKTKLMVVGLMLAVAAHAMNAVVLTNTVQGASATNITTAAITGQLALVSFVIPAASTATVKMVTAHSTLFNAIISNNTTNGMTRSYLVRGKVYDTGGLAVYPASYQPVPMLGTATVSFVQGLETTATNDWVTTILYE